MFKPCPGVTSNQASDPKRIAGPCLSLCLGTRTSVSSQAPAQAAQSAVHVVCAMIDPSCVAFDGPIDWLVRPDYRAFDAIASIRRLRFE